ncbi:MAG: RNA 2'-phosphotransferase [Proteobacteria bacterium]|nr:RNA 2'-phosphotransferase [Pseudomonadota bacterium]
MTPEHLIPVSKQLSRILRHRPESVGVVLDANGWCDVVELIAKLAEHGTTISLEELEVIVATSDKKRFSFSPDRERIRASQGHSVPVDLKLREKAPPPVLYHGTVRRNMQSIMKAGLLPMNRHHVHLSPDVATATAVGGRRGPPVVLIVDTHRMHKDGYRFFVSENGVWLAEVVPAKYLRAK